MPYSPKEGQVTYWPEIDEPAQEFVETIPAQWAIQPTSEEIERERILAVLAPKRPSK